MIIYNVTVCPVSREPFYGYVRIQDGKIAEVSQGDPVQPDDEMTDGCGGFLYPGFIDIHTHMGFIGDGASEEGIDVNEGSDPVTPGLRAIDGINYYDGYFRDAVASGVTSVVTGHGSLNVIVGSMIAVKTGAANLEDAYMGTVGMKFAFGENPKSYADRDEAPQTRSDIAALIRETLYKARQYMERKNSAESPSDAPDFDLGYEALIPLLEGKIKAHMHCHRADDILTALRICEEFSLKPLLIHCTEGYKIADILAKKNAAAVAGPIICDRGKPEMAHAYLGNAAALSKAGVPVAICTDHPEVSINFLLNSVAWCVKYGMSREDAIRAVTLTAAELAGTADRTGSIDVGKDADLVLLNGDPLDIMTDVVMTIVDGRIVYRAGSEKGA